MVVGKMVLVAKVAILVGTKMDQEVQINILEVDQVEKEVILVDTKMVQEAQINMLKVLVVVVGIMVDGKMVLEDRTNILVAALVEKVVIKVDGKMDREDITSFQVVQEVRVVIMADGKMAQEDQINIQEEDQEVKEVILEAMDVKVVILMVREKAMDLVVEVMQKEEIAFKEKEEQKKMHLNQTNKECLIRSEI